MINARFMYARPGNLFKEFIFEDNSQQVSSTGLQLPQARILRITAYKTIS